MLCGVLQESTWSWGFANPVWELLRGELKTLKNKQTNKKTFFFLVVTRPLLALCWRLCWGRGETQHRFAMAGVGQSALLSIHLPGRYFLFGPWGPCPHGQESGFELKRSVAPINFYTRGENVISSEPGTKWEASEFQTIKTQGHLPRWAWDADLGNAGVGTNSLSQGAGLKVCRVALSSDECPTWSCMLHGLVCTYRWHVWGWRSTPQLQKALPG